MLARQTDRMTVEEFLEWEQLQDEKHELIDGRPVLRAIRKGWVGPQAMAGGTTFHDVIAGNIFHALKSRLKGAPCRAHASNLAVRLASGLTRYPDVFVDCGPLIRSLTAQEPRIIFEVLSPSNRPLSQIELLDDYRGVPSVSQVVFLDQDEPLTLSWRRHEAGWHRQRLTGMDQQLELASLGFSLPFTEIYDDVPFSDVAP